MSGIAKRHYTAVTRYTTSTFVRMKLGDARTRLQPLQGLSEIAESDGPEHP